MKNPWLATTGLALALVFLSACGAGGSSVASASSLPQSSEASSASSSAQPVSSSLPEEELPQLNEDYLKGYWASYITVENLNAPNIKTRGLFQFEFASEGKFLVKVAYEMEGDNVKYYNYFSGTWQLQGNRLAIQAESTNEVYLGSTTIDVVVDVSIVEGAEKDTLAFTLVSGSGAGFPGEQTVNWERLKVF